MSASVVNLILLLSALLSALTGVSTNSRVVEPAAISRRVREAAPISVAIAHAAARPEQAVAGIGEVAGGAIEPAVIALAASATLLTNRRRE